MGESSQDGAGVQVGREGGGGGGVEVEWEGEGVHGVPSGHRIIIMGILTSVPVL